MTAEYAANFVDSVINLTGITSVASVTHDGGNIVLRGPDINVLPRTQLLADSGKEHGGDISMTLQGRANIEGRLTSNGEKGGGDITIARGGGITIGKTAHLASDSSKGSGGDIDIGAETGIAVIDGHLHSSGATGGGLAQNSGCWADMDGPE